MGNQEKLLGDQVCDSDSVPSVSSINRIVRNRLGSNNNSQNDLSQAPPTMVDPITQVIKIDPEIAHYFTHPLVYLYKSHLLVTQTFLVRFPLSCHATLRTLIP